MLTCSIVRRYLIGGLAILIPTAVQAQDTPAAGGEGTQLPAYEVGRALPPVPEGGTMLSLTLEEAIERALEANLDIQRARLDPIIQNHNMRTARAAFGTTFSTSFGYNNSTQRSTSQLDGGTRTTTQRYTWNSSLAKTLPWFGGRLTFNFNNSRTESNNVFSLLNPSYNTSTSLQYTQPLLAGFRTDNQRAALETQAIQSQITNLQVQAQIENIRHQVRQAYWALRAAIEQIEIQRRNLAQAEQLLAENQTLVRLGRMTDLQLLQAEAQVASAQQSLLAAQVQWQNQELNFKRLLISGPGDPLLNVTINPTDLPVLVDQEVDIEAAIQVALSQRMDIRQQREQLDISRINLEVSRAATLPDVSLSASYSLSGVGGNQYERSGLGGDPVLVQPGGWRDGLQALREFDTPTWNVSINASIPIGINTAKENYERARLQLQQSELALRSQELAIITQVTSAGLAVRSTYLQYEAARRSREAAERSAEAEMLRFSVGASRNFEVVQAQNALTQARLSEMQALINHVNAIAEFERVQRVGG